MKLRGFKIKATFYVLTGFFKFFVKRSQQTKHLQRLKLTNDTMFRK